MRACRAAELLKSPFELFSYVILVASYDDCALSVVVGLDWVAAVADEPESIESFSVELTAVATEAEAAESK